MIHLSVFIKMPRSRWVKGKTVLLYGRVYATMVCMLAIFFANAQTTTGSTQLADTAKPPSFVERVQAAGKQIAVKNVSEYQKSRLIFHQQDLIEETKKTTLQALTLVKSGMDTVGMHTELLEQERWFKVAQDGIFINQGSFQTHRNLTASANIIHEILARAQKRKEQVDSYERQLSSISLKLDSLGGDTALYQFPSDSVLIMQYFNKISAIAKELDPADSALKKAIVNVHGLQALVNQTVNQIAGRADELEELRRQLSDKAWHQEVTPMWVGTSFDRPLNEILHFSYQKARLTFYFYVANNASSALTLLVAIGLCFIFLRSLKQTLAEKELLSRSEGQLVVKSPALSAILIAVSLFQFIFSTPPYSFICSLWIICGISLTLIFRNFITGYWIRVWLLMFVFFILSCIGNLILQASRDERWLMLVLAVLGAASGIIILLKGPKQKLREKMMLYFIGLMIAFELASVVCNITGRYNLGKTFFTCGFLNVVTGVLFLWTIRLLNEGLALASKVYTGQNKKLFYINFDKVGEKVPTFFYYFLVVGWFIIIGRNFYSYRRIAEPFHAFLYAERSIGDYSFSVINLLSFIIILLVSVLTSRIVSYFASDSHHQTNGLQQEKRAGLGSWLLLIRVAIISIGIFLAMAASGFPMDKITLLVGALGVGIGLGLQRLVSNLVSGVIIAFEKPVNVGDIVEVSGQMGTMKSIGFRSSVMARFEGADVVIPNGDLLDSQLVNWTLGGNKRRMEVEVGVTYGTDLERVKTIVLEVLANDNRISHYPEPSVFFQAFSNSSIDIRILFWIAQFKDGFKMKSEVIQAIDVAFKANHIVIPFPQRDIHIYHETNTHNTAILTADKSDDLFTDKNQ